jgi:hypothetical protein
MLKRLKEKLKKRWKDFLGQGRVPTTCEKDYHLGNQSQQLR